jgi:5-carboxymethyl-2-hydroxymuconate isomerase
MFRSQKGIGKITQELLQQSSDAVDVMIEVFGISEIKSRVLRVYQAMISSHRGVYADAS